MTFLLHLFGSQGIFYCIIFPALVMVGPAGLLYMLYQCYVENDVSIFDLGSMQNHIFGRCNKGRQNLTLALFPGVCGRPLGFGWLFQGGPIPVLLIFLKPPSDRFKTCSL